MDFSEDAEIVFEDGDFDALWELDCNNSEPVGIEECGNDRSRDEGHDFLGPLVQPLPYHQCEEQTPQLAQQTLVISPNVRRIIPKATGKHVKMVAQKECRQPLPLEEHHVVLKDGSKQLTAATAIYGDHVQCIFGRVACLSESQLRDLKALQDAYNRCKLGGNEKKPLPPASFWVRKDKAEKQAKKQGKTISWMQNVDEIRYRVVRKKHIYFVQATDDCLRHDIRCSGDPIREKQRQFKKLMKYFSTIPDKAPLSIAQHLTRPVSCVSSSRSVCTQPTTNSNKDGAIPEPALSDTENEPTPLRDDGNTLMANSFSATASPPRPPCAKSHVSADSSQKQPRQKRSTSLPLPKAPQSQQLFHIDTLFNLKQNLHDICSQWVGDSEGVDRIVKEGLVSRFKNDIKHFLSRGLVDAIGDMKLDVLNAFGNNMVLCYNRLPVKPLVGQKGSQMFQIIEGDQSIEQQVVDTCKTLIAGSSGMNKAIRRGLVEAFKEDIEHFQTEGLVVVDSSIRANVVNFFGNRMADYCDYECLDLCQSLGTLSQQGAP